EVIAARLAARHHRYMPSSLLASQIATLEAPRDAIDIDVDAAVETQVQAIVEALQGGTANPVAADAP
ncbi:MAG TPA: gluconokinase, partial [Casimicrobiaceae bacterium]